MGKKKDQDNKVVYARGITRHDARAVVKLSKPNKVLLAGISDVGVRAAFKNLMLDAEYSAEVFKRTSSKKKEKEADASGE